MVQADSDILAGLRAWRLWTNWAWIDMIQRYRRSVLGPFWATLTMGVTIGGMGFVFATLFSQPVSTFLPYLAAGMITWGLIQTTLNDGCQIYLANSRMIQQFNLPLSIYAHRHVAKQFILFAHHIVIFFIVALIFGSKLNGWIVLALFGLVLIFVTSIFASLLIGILCARFRDIPPIVGSIVQLTFFVTPVMWNAEMLGNRVFIAHVNPFFHFIEVVRRPLLGMPPTALNYAVVIGSMILIGTVSLLFFSRFRHRVAFWL